MFNKSDRKQLKLKIGLSGPSGSGKSKGALYIAKGLGGKVAAIDTESGSMSYYSNEFEFDSVNLGAPYTPERYIEAIKASCDNGYNVLIIDSLSHAWFAQGGLLDQKSMLDAKGGSSFTNWKMITPKQNALMNAILSSQIHIIATMRSKSDHVIEDVNGKKVPKKVGLAPIQREGVDYEFGIFFELQQDHSVIVSKDRTGVFDGKSFKLSPAVGEALRNYVDPKKIPNLAPGA
jgi:hypothetical protein